MDPPSCSKSASTDSLEYDLPELPSLPQNERGISPEQSSKSSAPVRHLRPTECSICGKPANGYHYDVPSCNGCKTFFRRLCISEKNFLCKATGDCYDLTKPNRPMKCRPCRYEKCIMSGMNPLAMQVDEKEATAGNFQKLTKRANISSCKNDEEYENDKIHQLVKKQIIEHITSKEAMMQKVVGAVNYLEMKIHKFRLSSYNPHWKNLPNLEGFLKMGTIISLATTTEPMPGWPLKASPVPPKPPNFSMANGPQYSPNKKQWLMYDLMLSIEYAKAFGFFTELDFKDRMILMKYVALALMNLQISYYTVSRKYDSIVHPDGSMPPAKVGMVYNETVMSIAPLIRFEIEKTEFALLKAICLCNPAVPNLSDHAREILSKEREQYADALFDHCLRNRRDGPTQFAELIGMVDLLERQQRMQKDLHLLHVAPFVAKIPSEHKMWLVEDIMND
ncbi:unnamed protein product [Caenorhabditis nigoni]